MLGQPTMLAELPAPWPRPDRPPVVAMPLCLEYAGMRELAGTVGVAVLHGTCSFVSPKLVLMVRPDYAGRLCSDAHFRVDLRHITPGHSAKSRPVIRSYAST